MREPTGDQCQTHATWTDEHGFTYLAFFWPQMGGYHGKAVARRPTRKDNSEDSDSCVEIWVWHDGDFPFGGDQKNPAELHICDFNDWLESMQMLERFQYGEEIEEVKIEYATIPELTMGKVGVQLTEDQKKKILEIVRTTKNKPE